MLIDRSLNVAVPADAGCVAVPLSVPLAGFVPIAIVIGADELVRLPNWSWICTVTAGLTDAPATVFVGCCANTNLLSPAGKIGIAVLPALIGKVVSLTVTVPSVNHGGKS